MTIGLVSGQFVIYAQRKALVSAPGSVETYDGMMPDERRMEVRRKRGEVEGKGRGGGSCSMYCILRSVRHSHRIGDGRVIRNREKK